MAARRPQSHLILSWLAYTVLALFVAWYVFDAGQPAPARQVAYTCVIVMIPFCRTPDEADRVLETMASFGLRRGVNGLQVYVMCEIPSNVIPCGRKVGICGQAPSDYPEFAAFLVACGIDSISLNPDTLIETRRTIAEAEKKLTLTVS